MKDFAGLAATPGGAGGMPDHAPDAVMAAEALRARQPMGALVSADEVTNAIVYLVSSLSVSTTGIPLTVDDGMASVRVS